MAFIQSGLYNKVSSFWVGFPTKSLINLKRLALVFFGTFGDFKNWQIAIHSTKNRLLIT
jgi:hypothetical protein